MRDNRFHHHILRSLSRWTRALVLCAAMVSCSSPDALTGGDDDDEDGQPGESPSNASPVAGMDQDAARGVQVTLNASASTDPDGDPLEYVWRQIHGPDVTGGEGTLTGVAPVFTAPGQVSTVLFELTADDGSGPSEARDTIQVNVLENTQGAIFVDGDAGSDSDGDGSRARPYASISGAINRITGPDQDIYVMSRAGGARYDETAGTLSPPTTISLYGGFDRRWVRDVVNTRTGIDGASHAVQMGLVSVDAWFSGFDVQAAAAPAGESAFGLTADGGTAALYVEDNRIGTGDAGDGAQGVAAGGAYAVWLTDLARAEVRGNVLEPGAGGDGGPGVAGRDGNDAKSNGGNGSNPGAGGRGSGALNTIDGGAGGQGGSGVLTDDGDSGGDGEGAAGGDGGNGDPVGSGVGSDAKGGGGGRGGSGGQGGSGAGGLLDGRFVPGAGTAGSNAGHGSGGGGGGGGAGGVGLNGGGGGGGGGGGEGGIGGRGGGGGGASIGLLLDDVGDALVEGNTVVTANGGRGGSGGAGGLGGDGTKGGVGGPPECSFLGCSVARSGDGFEGGGGGSGGVGGRGGGGGGGPSFGIFVGPGIAPTVRINTITLGSGGEGGIGGARGLGGVSGGDGGSTGGSGGCCATDPGNAGINGSGGAGGWSFGVYDADPTDGALPVVESNGVTVGIAGNGGALGGAAGQAGERNF